MHINLNKEQNKITFPIKKLKNMAKSKTFSFVGDPVLTKTGHLFNAMLDTKKHVLKKMLSTV